MYKNSKFFKEFEFYSKLLNYQKFYILRKFEKPISTKFINFYSYLYDIHIFIIYIYYFYLSWLLFLN